MPNWPMRMIFYDKINLRLIRDQIYIKSRSNQDQIKIKSRKDQDPKNLGEMISGDFPPPLPPPPI
jgi:hypothetical protein